MNPRHRIRYVAGGLAGAIMATGLVVLGMNLAPAADRDVTLTSEVADDAPPETADPADESTTTSTTDPATTTTKPITLEGRVGRVEERVDKLEATTTTRLVCPPGLFIQGVPGRAPECLPNPYVPSTGPAVTSTTINSSTTTNPTPVTLAPPAPTTPIWQWSMKDQGMKENGAFVVTVRNAGGSGVLPTVLTGTWTTEDPGGGYLLLPSDGRTVGAGETATWSVVMGQVRGAGSPEAMSNEEAAKAARGEKVKMKNGVEMPVKWTATLL